MKFHLMPLPGSSPDFSSLEPLEQRVGVVAVDVDLGEHRERHAEAPVAERRDLRLVARLLVAELVAREAEHGEAAVGVLVVQLLQPGVLRGEPALRGGVDDQHDLALVGREVGVGAVDGAGGEVPE